MIYTGNYDHRNILKNKQGAEEMRKAVNAYLSHHLDDICYTESQFTVRSAIEDNLSELKKMYPNDPRYGISESDVECYLNIMNDAGAHCRYATDLEVYAIAHIYECTIHVYQEDDTDLSRYKWINTFDGIVGGEKVQSICFCWTGNHYQALVPTNVSAPIALTHDDSLPGHVKERNANLQVYHKNQITKEMLEDALAVYTQDPNRAPKCVDHKATLAALEEPMNSRQPKKVERGRKRDKPKDRKAKYRCSLTSQEKEVIRVKESAERKKKRSTEKEKTRAQVRQSYASHPHLEKKRIAQQEYRKRLKKKVKMEHVSVLNSEKKGTHSTEGAHTVDVSCSSKSGTGIPIVEDTAREESIKHGIGHKNKKQKKIQLEDANIPSRKDWSELPWLKSKASALSSRSILVCDNCKRRQISSSSPKYRLHFTRIPSTKIRRIRHKLKMLNDHQLIATRRKYVLCQNCLAFLHNSERVKHMNKTQKDHLLDWSNSWPAFLYNLLSGEETWNKKPFYETYSPSFLWQFIPLSIRPYWIDAISDIGGGSYSGCTLDWPPSFFRDRSDDIHNFWSDITSYQFPRFLRALKDTAAIPTTFVPDVLCPWGCTEFCFRAEHLDLGVVIQRYLRKVVLNLPQKKLYEHVQFVETSREDYIRQDLEYDSVMLKPIWPILPSVGLVRGKGLMTLVCRFHCKYEEIKRLYVHPPRKPHHNLSSVQSDQLSHCVTKPRCIKPQRKGVYSSSYPLMAQQCSYSGVDSMNVCNEGKFGRCSVMRTGHEALSIAGREDINHLVSQNIAKGVMTCSLGEDLRARAAKYYPPGSLSKFIQGSTYVGLSDCMLLQKDMYEDNTIVAVVRKRNRETRLMEDVNIVCGRSWARTINIMQMEDWEGYGYPFKPVQKYHCNKRDSPTMMLWTLAGVITGCKELWCAIDQKRRPFHYNGWEGYMLMHLHTVYMLHEKSYTAKLSPFELKKSKSATAMLNHIHRFVPLALNSSSFNTLPSLYQFDLNYWRLLFPRLDFPDVAIFPDMSHTVASPAEVIQSNVVLIVEMNPMSSVGIEFEHFYVGGSEYEARSVTCLQSLCSASSSSAFDGVRYVRHGKGFMRWWKQCRFHKQIKPTCLLMTQCTASSIVDDMPSTCFARVLVYVKVHQHAAEEYKLEFLRSLGGQTRAFCRCSEFPLTFTDKREKKRRCIVDGCSRFETYACCNVSCCTRICARCFNGIRENEIVYFDPPLDEDNDDDEIVDQPTFEESDDEEAVEEAATLREKIIEAQKKAVERDEADGEQADVGDEFFLDEYVTAGNYNPMDEDEDTTNTFVPTTTDAGEFPYSIVSRSVSNRITVPCHVIMNQVGVLCKRYNRRITGSQVQQRFIHQMVSSICGSSFPLMYPTGSCFPSHFYANASHDRCAILGSMPLFCYTTTKNPHGFASRLAIARNHITHSSSSTSTDHCLTAFDYDGQCNEVAGSIDSRVINRNGFVADLVTGVALHDPKKSELSESVDSRQAAQDLGATQKYHSSDLFVTHTVNMATHPGIKHLYRHKESMEWTKFIPGYQYMSNAEKNDVTYSFEQAYGTVVTRCWLEVTKLLLDHITFNPTLFGCPVVNTHWRYEYQEGAGNLPHIHGLIELSKKKEHMSDPAFRRSVYDLQKCCVADVIPTKDIPQFVKDGILDSPADWFTVNDLARQILCHDRHTERCMKKVTSENGPDSVRCRALDIARESTHPLEHEFKPFHFQWPKPCLDVLAEIGLYKRPTKEKPQGEFFNKMFVPTRHLGRIKPGCKDKMSPVSAVLFAGFRSMENFQIVTNTNGVARYLVKYIMSIDANNRVVVYCDANTGAVYRVENQFLHNTKITGSQKNEEKAFTKSREHNNATGRAIAPPEMIQQILGSSEVITTYQHARISTQPFELRPTTKIELDSKGNLEWPEYLLNQDEDLVFSDDDDLDELEDATSSQSPTQTARIRLFRRNPYRRMPKNQLLLYRQNGKGSTRFDMVGQFSLRPVELLQLFPTLENYFRWFHIDEFRMDAGSIAGELKEDVTKCKWIDGFGRLVRLRSLACKEVLDYLIGRTDVGLAPHSLNLKHHLLSKLRNYTNPAVCNQRSDFYERFLIASVERQLPIPVVSNISPQDAIPFLCHIMLVLGEYETELDFRMEPTIRQSMRKANMIGPATDTQSLVRYSNSIMVRIVDDVLPFLPITMRRMADYIVTAKRLLDSVLLHDEITTPELPGCLLAELLDTKEEKMQKFWQDVKDNQIAAIYGPLDESNPNIPSRQEVSQSSKASPLEWNILTWFEKSIRQSQSSFLEQRFAIEHGKRAIDKYMNSIGPEATTLTKGVFIHGVPGSGKTHLLLLLCLYALTHGLKVMTTSLMAARAFAVGGIHAHKLWCWHVAKNITPYRQAELSLDKLRRKSQINFNHAIRTMDVLAIDETAQLSAEEVATIDIIFRKARNTKLPFGGVLLLGALDPFQFGPIEGLPFLVSSFVLTNFLLIGLYHSVRAHSDPNFRRIQDMTRMPPSELLRHPATERVFKRLVANTLTFVDSWNDPLITADTQRMYARRKPAQRASEMYVDACIRQFNADGTGYVISRAEDFQQREGSRGEYTRATARPIINALNRKLKEPPRLLFWRGGQYYATVNKPATTNTNGFYQSQLMVMFEVPSIENVQAKAPIQMLVADPGVSLNSIDMATMTEEEVLNTGKWKRVTVSCAPQRNVTISGLMGYRRQYSLIHVGSSTIHKQTGNTLEKAAIEIIAQGNEQSAPWSDEQAVVLLSRTEVGNQTIIVGPKVAAINRIWDIITTGNQWRMYIEALLNRISITYSSNHTMPPEHNIFQYAEVYPYLPHAISPPKALQYIFL